MKYFNETYNSGVEAAKRYESLIIEHIGDIEAICSIDAEFKQLAINTGGSAVAVSVAVKENRDTVEVTMPGGNQKPAYEFKVTEAEADQVQAKAHELKALNMIDVTIKICGKWIWIEGNTKPYAKILGKNGAGCRFCPKKACWSWHVGKYFKRGKTLAMPEIETRFGAVKL